MADDSNNKVLTRRQAVAALGVGVLATGGAVAFVANQANNANQTNDLIKQNADEKIRELTFQLDDLSRQMTELTQQKQALAEQNQDTQAQLDAARLQLQLYQGLGGLYATLDNIGIDSVVGTALVAFKGSLDALQGGVNLLREGIVSSENALDNFERAFANIRTGLTGAESAWANVGALLKNAQDLVGQATSPVLPFVDQAGRFFDDLLAKIPFGAGEGARQTLNGIKGLMVAIPDALDTLDDSLFSTLREGWFSDDNARNLEATLAKPIVNGVLQPARAFLDRVDLTLNDWETKVTQPVNDALAQRKIVIEQISEYKNKHNLA